VVPVGSLIARFGVTLSLPSVVGRDGVLQVLEPELAPEERRALEVSAANLREALAQAA
jgi:L-lactate dehydrogenase